MALSGRLDSAHFPYIPLRLVIGNLAIDLEALLDTGFDGDVALPTRLLPASQPDDYEAWVLADGSRIVAPAFEAWVTLASLGSFQVHATVIGDEPIVGRGVSDQFTITLDHGRRLLVEP